MSDKPSNEEKSDEDKVNIGDGIEKATPGVSGVGVGENIIASDSPYDDGEPVKPEQPDTDDRQDTLSEVIKKNPAQNVSVNLLKYVVLILILIALLILATTFFTSSDSNDNPLNSIIPPDASDHVKKEEGKSDPDPINLIGEVPLIDPLAIITLREDLSLVRDENTLLREHIDELILSSAQQVIRIDQLKVGFDEIITTRIPALASANGVFEQKLDSVSAGVQQNKERIIKALKHKRETPPFLLLSVDEWGGSVSAAINMAGSVTTVSVGDVHAGWVINRIERSCIYVSRPDIKEIKICVSGAQ